MTDPLTMPPILRLPQELLDDILSLIDLHSDLINFALASKACTRLVIPRHNEYRVIRARYIYPHLWEHLARRADLARNVREVYICERQDYTASDHVPKTLLRDSESKALQIGDWSDTITAKNMGNALRHMRDLRTFSWAWDHMVTADGNVKMVYENEVFGALGGLKCLERLALHNMFFLKFSKEDKRNLNGSTYPLWNVANLTSLCLSGPVWIKPTNERHIVSLLRRCPNLLHLDIPMEFEPLGSVHLPKLESLCLTMQCGTHTAIDESRARFIEKHPTIHKLYWTPILDIPIQPDCLPNLRLLRSSNNVIKALNKGSCVRKVESLEIISLTKNLVESMKWIDKGSLSKVRILGYDEFETLRVLAVRFPGITHVSLPPFDPHDMRRPIALEYWLELLPLFTNLEVFHSQGLWQAVEMDKNRMHQAICELAALCPNLRELDHYKYYSKRYNYNRVVITRNVDEEGVEHVGYEIRKPKCLRPFEGVIERDFDM